MADKTAGGLESVLCVEPSAKVFVQKSIQIRIVGIIRYILQPYCFSSNGISVKSSRDVRCTLLSLLPLFVYFFVLPSLLHPSILFNCFLCLFLFLFLLPLGKHMHCLWATLTLGSTLACLRSFMLSFSNIIIIGYDVSVKGDQVHTCACVCTIVL